MRPPKLVPHLIRRYRRIGGLTQDELAALLGASDGAKVGRNERFRRRPTVEAVLACEVIFGAPAKDIFSGLYDDVCTKTVDRARRLADRLQSLPETPRTRRVLALVESIAFGTPRTTSIP